MRVSFVIPCLNEEGNVRAIAGQLFEIENTLLNKNIQVEFDIIYIDDGSSDATWGEVEALASNDHRISGIRLARNFGHQSALLAGYSASTGDAVVSIDADLQDDPSAVPEMIAQHIRGADIVFAVRSDRASDSFFKRVTARAFYSFLLVMGVRVVYDHADFRLLSRRAVRALKNYRETNLFLRGIIADLGFETAVVHFQRGRRNRGATKYSLPKMVGLAMDGVTSFSVAPLRLVTLTGFSVFAAALVGSLWAVWVKFFGNGYVAGWASTILPIFILGGLQILCLGIIGEYVGKIYFESKRRPRFLIRDTCGANIGASFIESYRYEESI